MKSPLRRSLISLTSYPAAAADIAMRNPISHAFR